MQTSGTNSEHKHSEIVKTQKTPSLSIVKYVQ